MVGKTARFCSAGVALRAVKWFIRIIQAYVCMRVLGLGKTRNGIAMSVVAWKCFLGKKCFSASNLHRWEMCLVRKNANIWPYFGYNSSVPIDPVFMCECWCMTLQWWLILIGSKVWYHHFLSCEVHLVQSGTCELRSFVKKSIITRDLCC